jgi:hypothetical protein
MELFIAFVVGDRQVQALAYGLTMWLADLPGRTVRILPSCRACSACGRHLLPDHGMARFRHMATE